MFLLLLLFTTSFLPELRPFAAESWKPVSQPARRYADRAERTLRFTSERLAHFEAADRCGAALWLSYGRTVGSELSDAWYDASQLAADAALAELGEPGALCRQAKTVAFLDLVARPEPAGGYYPRANVDGQQVTTRDVYGDDNALLGLAFLEARATSDDPSWRRELLERAVSAATYLEQGGLWDDTFGGGFWWNTARGAIGEGKPGQTTALAALLFGRLYEETGETSYARRALASLDWLDARLYDPVAGLYRYGLRHADQTTQRGEVLDERFFSYDQGILIELHLLFDRSIAPGQGHLERARSLAERTYETFWVPNRGFRLSSAFEDVYTAYSAWLTQSYLRLHAADPDPRWLEIARANLDALEALALDPSDGGYYHLQHRCSEPSGPGCEAGQDWTVERDKLLVSQAWMQRAQALLAARATELPVE